MNQDLFSELDHITRTGYGRKRQALIDLYMPELQTEIITALKEYADTHNSKSVVLTLEKIFYSGTEKTKFGEKYSISQPGIAPITDIPDSFELDYIANCLQKYFASTGIECKYHNGLLHLNWLKHRRSWCSIQ